MDRPKYVQEHKTRHGNKTYYYRSGKAGRLIRLPNEYGTDEFWQAVEAAKIADPVPLGLRFARYDKQMTSRVGRVMVAAVRAARTRSRTRGWAFDLTTDWALDMAREKDFRCALTGIPFFAKTTAKSKVHPFTPSIDRIDCALGYTKDNVRIVVWAINAMLLDWGEEVFASVARRYHAHKAKLDGAMLAPEYTAITRDNILLESIGSERANSAWCGQEKCNNAGNTAR